MTNRIKTFGSNTFSANTFGAVGNSTDNSEFLEISASAVGNSIGSVTEYIVDVEIAAASIGDSTAINSSYWVDVEIAAASIGDSTATCRIKRGAASSAAGLLSGQKQASKKKRKDEDDEINEVFIVEIVFLGNHTIDGFVILKETVLVTAELMSESGLDVTSAGIRTIELPEVVEVEIRQVA